MNTTNKIVIINNDNKNDHHNDNHTTVIHDKNKPKVIGEYRLPSVNDKVPISSLMDIRLMASESGVCTKKKKIRQKVAAERNRKPRRRRTRVNLGTLAQTWRGVLRDRDKWTSVLSFPLTPYPRDFISCSHPAMMQLAPCKECKTPDPCPVCGNLNYTYIKSLRYFSLHCLDAFCQAFLTEPWRSRHPASAYLPQVILDQQGGHRPMGVGHGLLNNSQLSALLRLIGHNFSAFQGRTRIARTPEGTSNISRGSAGPWTHLSFKC